jgi:hypothetical protein
MNHASIFVARLDSGSPHPITPSPVEQELDRFVKENQ